MRLIATLLTCIGLGMAAATAAQVPPAPPTSAGTAAAEPVTIESYYRVRWGGGAEFRRLYDRNETVLLREMQRLGFITSFRLEQPYTHMAGDQRWDFRATIVYRDAATAVVTGGAYDQAFEAARARLLPDKAAFDAEQARRFSLLEEHWDVVVTPVTAD